MTATLAQIQRHPIKAHGRETLASVALLAGAALPGDRRWAVIHTRSKVDPARPEWLGSVNFMIGTKLPKLVAISVATDGDRVTLRHPERPEITFAPDLAEDQARFLEWVRPLNEPDHPAAAGIVSLGARGVTDTNYPSVSLLNLASNADLSARMGVDLSPLRWRVNLWLDGLQPWVEENWVGRELRIGDARLKVEEPVVRCKMTMANPQTGARDADTLAALRTAFGHQNFGIYATVIEPGEIRPGDRVVLA